MIRKLLARQGVRYLISGGISVCASWAAMLALNAAAYGMESHPGPAAGAMLGLANWTSGMLAAYALNRTWVFRSRRPVSREFPAFLASRLGTLAVDQVLRQAFGAAGIGLYVTTLLCFAVTTVLNYFIGKEAVFSGGE